MPWATEADTLTLTGVTVDAAVLAQAQGVIDLFAGVTEDTENITARNLRLLKAAVAYQAAWMHGQLDVTTRTEVSRLEQDGSVIWLDGHPDALVLAPLARRALAGLSWLRRTGTIRVRNGTRRFRDWEAYADAWMRDESPDCHSGHWRPL